jgi:TRAP-type mannitol/chloroaromatic compound transport system permease small subunit
MASTEPSATYSLGFRWAQDLYVWLSGAMFTAVAAFALLRDEHVRVDIVYRPASKRFNATADWSGLLWRPIGCHETRLGHRQI